MARWKRRALAGWAVVPFILGAVLGGVVVHAASPPKSARLALAWAERLGEDGRSHQESANFVLVWGAQAQTDPSVTAIGLESQSGALLDRLERYYALYVSTVGVATESGDLARNKIAVVLSPDSADPSPDADADADAEAEAAGDDAADDARDPEAPPGADGRVSDGLGVLDVSAEASRAPSWDVAHALAQVILDLGASSSDADTGGGLEAGTAAFLATLAVPRGAGDLSGFVGAENLRWASARHGDGTGLLLQYLADLDGVDVVGRIWRAGLPDEDPLETYRRVSGLTAAALASRVAGFAGHALTWDFTNQADLLGALDVLPAAVVADRSTPVEAVDAAAGHFRVSTALAPAAGGFATVRLAPSSDGEVRLRLRGHGASGGVAWTFGFVAVKEGVARYGRLTSGTYEEISFSMQPGETELYLVVAPMPATLTGSSPTSGYPQTVRYPFEFRVLGAAPVGAASGSAVPAPTPGGHRHPNGGGWVDDLAEVEASVFVAEHAVVGARATVTGSVRVEGRGRIEPDAEVGGTVVVRDNAIVASGAVLGGDLVVGGDAVVELTCSSGVYLRYDPQRSCDGKNPEEDVTVEPAVFDTESLAITALAPALPPIDPTQSPSESSTPTSTSSAGPTPTPRSSTTSAGSVPAPTGGGDEPRPTPSDVALQAPLAAVPTCTAVAVIQNSWPGGYQAQVTVTAGSETLGGWTVTWTVPEGQAVGGAWGAGVSVVGSTATATSVSWNAHIAAGRSLTFGMMGTMPGAVTAPSMACTGAR